MCAAALEEYCGSIFWNVSYLKRPDPDLPLCVEQTVLVWIPLCFLWLCAPWHLLALCQSANVNTKQLSKLYICKQGEVRDVPRFSLFYISFGLKLISLVLSTVADIPPEAKDLIKKVPFICYWFCLFIEPCFYPQNPEAGAAFLSRITFNWLNSMVLKGYKQPLVQEDMWDLNESDSTAFINERFQHFMKPELDAARVRFQNKMKRKLFQNIHSAQEDPQQNGLSNEKKKKDNKEEENYPNSWLITTIYKTFKRILIESFCFKLLEDVLTFVSPQLLKLMISFTQDKSRYAWEGYLYAVLLMVVALLQSLTLQQYFQRCHVLGMKVRTALMAAVYKKALVVSNDTRKESTVGEMVNLMSADAQRFNDVTNFIHLLWSCPLQIIISIVFLWLELGPSVLAGLGVMVLIIPTNAVLATKARKLQIENMNFKDKRMKIMNEILNGIKILKLYAWEPSFQKQVEDIRGEELKVMKKSAYLHSFSILTSCCIPALVSLATFAIFVSVSNDNVLTAERAFTSISLFNILRAPLAMLPMLIASIVQVSEQITVFMCADHLLSSVLVCVHFLDTAVSICDGSFAWEKDAKPLLKDVNLDIEPGRLVAVVGAVGSGKSSLMSALLGEMHSTKGFINIGGSLAFVPQQAWIQNATLKDNILFGSPHEEENFKKVIEACALAPDLELLPGGDLTEIGEKGINLSGGQKQRVSLARAVYSQADIYLLDDPLSAVDSHVGKHLFENVIGPNGLLKDKTRILVTHGISFLPYVDEIVVLENGVISEVGSYENLRASGGTFSKFLDTYATEQRNQRNSETGDYNLFLMKPGKQLVSNTIFSRMSISFFFFFIFSVRLRRNNSLTKSANADEPQKGQKLIEKETMEIGQVTKCFLFLQYLRAMGWGYSAMVFLIYFIQTAAFTGQNLWLSDWTSDSVEYYNMTYPSWKRDTRVGVFGALGVAQGLFVFFGTLLLANASIDASRILHSRLLNNILRVPMVFFDTTPIGRVINRFAKDIFTIDEAIPASLRSCLLCLMSVLGTVFVICMATPFFAIVIIPLALIYFFVQRFYIAASRQLRRLDSVSRSPIYSHFGETVSGLSVIRAYKHQERFLKHNEVTIDENLKSIYLRIVSDRWLAIRLEFVGNLVVFFAALFAVISRDSIDSNVVGLSVSYALNVTQTLNWLVMTTSALETNIVAVERVNEYTQLKNEADWVTDTRPPQMWPEAGRVHFENYKVRYRPELDLVLHGITCDINSTEKIGIVGRTGAGKSSLTNCLFRIIEAAEGRILIDDVDIATIGLHDLRHRLTIIPQDPVLFSGSLRMNLDPFDKFSDEEIWRVLELSHLKSYVSGLQEGLQHKVAEGGENLSVGQRQLLCLARALLRKSRILILDEATAAVDLETDNLIQNTIRKEFSDCTVLTIAHRLHSIMDSSRVMVLDAGKVVEFDSPSNLLEKEGHFYAMARDAGITLESNTNL
uniref:ATP-binding cassette, sub-family C (CFTR/MRP), member 2 n=1 Tax=Astatotilapia calliptera TaxID=8154 RepID=A0A3P8P981_ASTCA